MRSWLVTRAFSPCSDMIIRLAEKSGRKSRGTSVPEDSSDLEARSRSWSQGHCQGLHHQGQDRALWRRFGAARKRPFAELASLETLHDGVPVATAEKACSKTWKLPWYAAVDHQDRQAH